MTFHKEEAVAVEDPSLLRAPRTFPKERRLQWRQPASSSTSSTTTITSHASSSCDSRSAESDDWSSGSSSSSGGGGGGGDGGGGGGGGSTDTTIATSISSTSSFESHCSTLLIGRGRFPFPVTSPTTATTTRFGYEENYSTILPWNDDPEHAVTMLLGKDHDCSLEMVRFAFASGAHEPAAVLVSLAYLSSERPRRAAGGDTNPEAAFSPRSAASYDEAVRVLGRFLAEDSVSENGRRRTSRLECLRILVTLRSPLRAVWQSRESILSETLSFVTERDFVWERADEHSDRVLLWELRAVCLSELRRRKRRQLERRVDRIRKTGDEVASGITAGARLIERGLDRSVDAVADRLDRTGEFVKDRLEPDRESLFRDPRSGVVALAYTGSARRVTAAAREAVSAATAGLRDASAKGVERAAAARRLGDRNLGRAGGGGNCCCGSDSPPPYRETREALAAAGRVGLAGLGAAVIVGEATRRGSRSVVSKTASVAADVVQHKYGRRAAQVVRDASETAGNLFVACSGLGAFRRKRPLGRKGVVKLVAKSTGKLHLQREGSSMKPVDSEQRRVVKPRQSVNVDNHQSQTGSRAVKGRSQNGQQEENVTCNDIEGDMT